MYFKDNGKDVSEQIRDRFHELQLDVDGFESLRYVGIQTTIPPTDFDSIRDVLNEEITRNCNRPQRSPQIVYLTLKVR
jgi:zinc finger FYVE domain-containing protein 1